MSRAEKFIQEYTRNFSNEYWDAEGSYHPWLSPYGARRAVEIAREEIYEWLEENAHKYATVGIYTNAMINDLKQAMKDE